jgi:hypothetical protein
MVRLALQPSFNVAVRFGLTIISRAFAHARIGAVVKIRKNHSKGSRKFKSSSHPARPMFDGSVRGVPKILGGFLFRIIQMNRSQAKGGELETRMSPNAPYQNLHRSHSYGF